MTDGPYLDRIVELHLKGDDGAANMHRLCGWLSHSVLGRTAPGSTVATWCGTGMLENVLAVARGEVDVAVATPSCAVALVRDGRLTGAGPLPQLRALGTIPQFDRLVLAVRAEHGITSLDELRRWPRPIRVSAEADGEAFFGIGARVLMDGIGLGAAVLAERGGGFVDFTPVRDERPGAHWSDRVFGPLRSGDVDAVVMEGIMVPAWQELAVDPGVRFLTLDDEAVARIDQGCGWPVATIPAGYFPGQDEPVSALEFSDFLVLCRDDLPDDVAHLLAWSMGETRSLFEAQYRHIPPERSPVTYPLDPVAMGRTTIPLHPGASRYYEALGRDSS